MVVTFAPTWGSYSTDDPAYPAGTLDWSSDAALRGQPPLILFEAVRQAYVQRLGPLGSATPVLLSACPDVGYDAQAWDRVLALGSAWTLAASYVNHTDNAGNWHGESSIPEWSEATLLSALGDATRLPTTTRHTAAWLRQQMRVIDLCRWTRTAALEYGIHGALVQANAVSKGASGHATWADAVAAFSIAAFLPNPTGGFRLAGFGVRGIGGSTYGIFRYGHDVKLTYAPPSVCAIDVYGLMGAYKPEIGTFEYLDTEFTGTVNGSLILLGSLAAATSWTGALLGTFGQEAGLPATGAGISTYGQGWQFPAAVSTATGILKHDVTGGFTLLT